MKKKIPGSTAGDQFPQYQGIILFLNRRCALGCASCNVRALPDHSGELSSWWLSAFFERVENLRFSGHLLWTGGEPFLSHAALQTGITLAAAKGYHSEILTSGDWFGCHPEWLEAAARSRNLSMRISLDAFHQEKVPLSLVLSLLRRAWQLGLEINFTLRDIPGHQPVNRYLEEIKRQLPDFYAHNRHRSRWLHYLPHIPLSSREASVSPGGMANPGRAAYKRSCPMIFRDLVLGEDGLVYPCCGFFGFPFHRRLAVGDPLEESWEALGNRQRCHPLFNILREKGPYGICRELDLVPEKWEWPWFQTPCHLCLALFSKAGEQILEYFSPGAESSTGAVEHVSR